MGILVPPLINLILPSQFSYLPFTANYVMYTHVSALMHSPNA